MPQPPLDYQTPGLNWPRKLWPKPAATTYLTLAATLLFCFILASLFVVWLMLRPQPPMQGKHYEITVAALYFSAVLFLTIPIILINIVIKSRLPALHNRILRTIILLHSLLAILTLACIAFLYWL